MQQINDPDTVVEAAVEVPNGTKDTVENGAKEGDESTAEGSTGGKGTSNPQFQKVPRWI